MGVRIDVTRGLAGRAGRPDRPDRHGLPGRSAIAAAHQNTHQSTGGHTTGLQTAWSLADAELGAVGTRRAPGPRPTGGAAGTARPDGPAGSLGVEREADAEQEGGVGDAAYAVSRAEDAVVAERLIALVELARGGDREAFGQLYDHYQPSVYRFLYYRLGGSVTLAEDLTAETFFRALRSMSTFRWQGKDFGAWLMTIARNLTTDHFKAGRTRLERTTEDLADLDSAAEGPEDEVLTTLTNETLLAALHRLPVDQRECLIMRFLQGLSIAETAEVLGRSSGAIKQLQLRAVRALAKLLPQHL